MTQIIGLGAYSRVGKGTLARNIMRRVCSHNQTMRCGIMSFATKLKDVCYQLYGWAGLKEEAYYDTPDGELDRDVVLPALGMTPVQVWCEFGNAIREHVYSATWVDYVLKQTDKYDLMVIPDTRFPNEIEAIRSLSGTAIKVVRPGFGPRNTVADKALLGYKDWDYVVGGSGAMSELQQWGDKLGQWILGGRKPVQSAQEREAALAVEVLP
jgi:hypothetical protein